MYIFLNEAAASDRNMKGILIDGGIRLISNYLLNNFDA